MTKKRENRWLLKMRSACSFWFAFLLIDFINLITFFYKEPSFYSFSSEWYWNLISFLLLLLFVVISYYWNNSYKRFMCLWICKNCDQNFSDSYFCRSSVRGKNIFIGWFYTIKYYWKISQEIKKARRFYSITSQQKKYVNSLYWLNISFSMSLVLIANMLRLVYWSILEDDFYQHYVFITSFSAIILFLSLCWIVIATIKTHLANGKKISFWRLLPPFAFMKKNIC